MTAETTDWAGPGRFLPPPSRPCERTARGTSRSHLRGARSASGRCSSTSGCRTPTRRYRWSSGSTAAASCSATAATCRIPSGRTRCSTRCSTPASRRHHRLPACAGGAVPGAAARREGRRPVPAGARRRAGDRDRPDRRHGASRPAAISPPSLAHRAPPRPRGLARRRRALERGGRRRRLVRPRRPHHHAAKDAATADRRQAAAGTGHAAEGPPDPRPRGRGARRRQPDHPRHPGAPPFLLVHGTADWLVPYAQSQQLHAALTVAGVDCRLVPVEDAQHIFDGLRRHRRRRPALRRLPGRGPAMSDLTVQPVTVEHHREPLGIGETSRGSRGCPDRAARLAAGRLRAGDRAGTAAGRRAGSTPPSRCSCPGRPPLTSRERRTVRVRVWGEGGGRAVGLERGRRGRGRPAGPRRLDGALVQPDPAGGAEEPALLLRREFVLDRPVARARLYVTAHGVYEAELNGSAVGDHVLAPGWTSYRHRLRYQTYDVTDLLVEGPNAIGALLADGWFRGHLGFSGSRAHLRRSPGVLAQLEVDHADGTGRRSSPTTAWRAASGPLTRAGIYERRDLRRPPRRPGWSSPGFDDAAGAGGGRLRWTPATLVAPTGPPVRRTEVLPVREITTSPSGRTLVDFGQNLVGRVRLPVPDGPAGTEITLRHAEVLEHGELGTRPLRQAAPDRRRRPRGAGPRTGSRASPSTASATPRSTAGRAS